ncbi:DUF4124 domain-containing protein [Marinobacter oulmenensis]|uniref:DUF4124 domain-containing protein n=1 Tax=Marinobacter oulmenensis TaxID=643747 RepID=A0A840UM40_9GAMM|nr:DUF4124 domain-containing protein [Marinobacter oulmenensis]MBB5321907.1 hypothetical protein [Marinobacter oulmenensis]
MFRWLGKTRHPALVFALAMTVVSPGHAEIYKWVDENGEVHFSDRKDHRLEQEVVNVRPSPSEWSRFDIKVETVDVELSDAEHQQIVDGVNSVYEFYDRVMSFDMYQTVPVNILIFKGAREYQNYLAGKGGGLAVASYGVYMPREHQIAVYMQEDKPRTFRTIKHEVSHAVLHSLVPYAPSWLNEGLAEQMEMLGRDESGLYFEHHPENRWVVAKAREQGRLAAIGEFLKLPSIKWRHSDFSGSSSVRAQAGQFVYFLLAKPTRRNFVVRLMHNFDRGDRTLSYYLVDEHYLGGVAMLNSDWARWVSDQGEGIIRL